MYSKYEIYQSHIWTVFPLKRRVSFMFTQCNDTVHREVEYCNFVTLRARLA